jgi:hypothetical protein
MSGAGHCGTRLKSLFKWNPGIIKESAKKYLIPVHIITSV